MNFLNIQVINNVLIPKRTFLKYEYITQKAKLRFLIYDLNKMNATENLHIEPYGRDTYLVGDCLDDNNYWRHSMLRLDSCLGDKRGLWPI